MLQIQNGVKNGGETAYNPRHETLDMFKLKKTLIDIFN